METRIKELEEQLAEAKALAELNQKDCDELTEKNVKGALERIFLQKEVEQLKALCESLQADGVQYRSLLEAKDKVIADLTDKLIEALEQLQKAGQSVGTEDN